MTVVHGWTERSGLRAAVHLPERAALGVVICPPLGQEGVIAYQTLRLLADELERRGVAAVRYDPPGRGDSAPCTDADGLVSGADEAAGLLHQAGCSRLAYVGLASGAFAACRAVTADDALVLWDAPSSGRVWLRRQRALAALTLGTERLADDDGVETIVGADLSRAETAVIEQAAVTADVARQCLMAVRRRRAHRGDGVHADRVEVDGMEQLLDRSSIAAMIPGQAVTAIADWLAALGTGERASLEAPELATELRGPGFVERIRLLGPDRLFAIETAAPDAPADAPLVLLHNGASEHRSGAADFQVTLARELARDGLRTVRADRRGTGESGELSADSPDLMFTQTWVDDQEAIIDELGAEGDRLAIVGHCVGGWLAGYAAPHHPRLVVSVSQDAFRAPSEPNEVRELHRQINSVSPARHRLRAVFNRWAPPWLRYALARHTVRGDVEAHFSALSSMGIPTVLVQSPIDVAVFDSLAGTEALRRLGGGIEVLRYEDGDHALFSRPMRERLLSEVRARLATAFALRVTEGSGA